jgi:predicted lipoprotein with Yx(FWY)xxD motif
MSRFQGSLRARGHKVAAGSVAALAAAATLVGIALAQTVTLQVADNASVTNQVGSTMRESIVVSSHGFALYELTGDSEQHPECTGANSCFSFWPPVRVSSANTLSKALGIRGKLRVWQRDGFFQVTLGGHPLYRYAPDTQRDTATGQGIQSFGGTWHVAVAAASSPRGGATSSSSGIPQGANAGDGDSDNHGAPSDGDGNR